MRCSGKRRALDCYAIYTDHINTPRLVTLVNNPLNPVPLTDTSNDLAQTSGDAIQGISPLAMPVWQMAYSPFGVDLANGYEAKPTTINNNFKPDLWEWVGLPEVGGASDWSWYAGGGNGQANSSVLTAPVLNIRYPGQYYDFESGLSQNWWRSYDARMGRYTQNDPIGLGGGMNRFGYVGGDPLSFTDPLGLERGPVSPNIGGPLPTSIPSPDGNRGDNSASGTLCEPYQPIKKWVCEKCVNWACSAGVVSSALCCGEAHRQCVIAAATEGGDASKCAAALMTCNAYGGRGSK